MATQISPNPIPTDKTLTLDPSIEWENNEDLLNKGYLMQEGVFTNNKEATLLNTDYIVSSNNFINNGTYNISGGYWTIMSQGVENNGKVIIGNEQISAGQADLNNFSDNGSEVGSIFTNNGSLEISHHFQIGDSNEVEPSDPSQNNSKSRLLNTKSGQITINEDGLIWNYHNFSNRGKVNNMGKIYTDLSNLEAAGFVNYGSYSGTGTVIGQWIDHGHVQPGTGKKGSVGGMLFNGDYQKKSGTTRVDVGGYSSALSNPKRAKHDWLQVTGDMEAGGKLRVRLTKNFQLKRRKLINIISVDGELSGQFEGLEEGALVGKFKGKKGRREKLYITYEAGDGNDVALYTKGGFGKRIRGSEASDSITGTNKAERIYGSDGDELINAGTGKDYAYGKGGKDTFKIDTGKGYVTIMDYVDGVDRMQFCGCQGVTSIITKNGNAHIYKYLGIAGKEDLQAVVLNTTAEGLNMEGIYIS